MFTYTTTLRMHDTDAAGVLYFVNQLRIAHEAFEAFMISAGLGIAQIIQNADFQIVIIHAEADYTAPLFLGDRITVEVIADHIGETSFAILYRFMKDDDHAVGIAKTVHVAIDRKTRKKRHLPVDVRATIEKLNRA